MPWRITPLSLLSDCFFSRYELSDRMCSIPGDSLPEHDTLWSSRKGEEEVTWHRTGLLDFQTLTRTLEFSDCRTLKPSDPQTFGVSGFWTFRLQDFQVFEVSDFWTFGFSDSGILRFCDFVTFEAYQWKKRTVAFQRMWSEMVNGFASVRAYTCGRDDSWKETLILRIRNNYMLFV